MIVLKNPPQDHSCSSTVMQQILESGLISPSFTANEEINAGIEVLVFLREIRIR